MKRRREQYTSDEDEVEQSNDIDGSQVERVDESNESEEEEAMVEDCDEDDEMRDQGSEERPMEPAEMNLIYDTSGDEPLICTYLADAVNWTSMQKVVGKILLEALEMPLNDPERKTKLDEIYKALRTWSNKIDNYMGEFAKKKIPKLSFKLIVHVENLQSVLENVIIICKIFRELINSKDLSIVYRTAVERVFKENFFTDKLVTVLERANDTLVFNYIKLRGRGNAMLEKDERVSMWICICAFKYIFTQFIKQERCLFYDEKQGWLKKKASEYFDECLIKKKFAGLKEALDDPEGDDVDVVSYQMYGSFVRDLSSMAKSKFSRLKELILREQPIRDNDVENANEAPKEEKETEESEKDSSDEESEKVSSDEEERENGNVGNLAFRRNDNRRNRRQSDDKYWDLSKYAEVASMEYDTTPFIPKQYAAIKYTPVVPGVVHVFDPESFAISHKPVSDYTVEELKMALEKLDGQFLEMERNWSFMTYLHSLWVKCCEVTFEYSPIPETYDDYIYCKTVADEVNVNYEGNRIEISTTTDAPLSTVHPDFLRKMEAILFHYLTFQLSVNMMKHHCMKIDLEGTYYNLLKSGAFDDYKYEQIEIGKKDSLERVKLANFFHGVDPTGVKAFPKDVREWSMRTSQYFVGTIESQAVTAYSRQIIYHFLLPGEMEWHLETTPWINEDPVIVMSASRSRKFMKVNEDCTKISFNMIRDRCLKVPSKDKKPYQYKMLLGDDSVKYNYLCFLMIHMIVASESIDEEKKLLPKYWLFFENNDIIDIHHRILFNQRRPTVSKVSKTKYTAAANVGNSTNDVDKSKVVKDRGDVISEDMTDYIDHYTVPIILWSGCAFHLFYSDSIYMKFYDIISAIENWLIILKTNPPTRFAVPSNLLCIFKDRIEGHAQRLKVLQGAT